MTHIVKHNELPMNAIMLSKAGKMIAMITNMIKVMMRMLIFRTPRNVLERPVRWGVGGTVGEEVLRPRRTSMVDIIGRPFRGTFVKGMMAMKMQIRTLSVLRYPEFPIMFAVTSSLTLSPNIRSPATAVAASSRYVKVKVCFRARGYLCGCRISRYMFGKTEWPPQGDIRRPNARGIVFQFAGKR